MKLPSIFRRGKWRKWECKEGLVWTVRYRNTRYKALHRWHTWFAWHPVRIASQKMAWLTTVQRKGKYELTGYVECSWRWEHRGINDGPHI